MVSRGWHLGLLSLLALIAHGGLALADTSLVATGSVTTGYSTNILGAPESDNPNVAQPVEADGFTNLNPGLSAAYEHRRGVHNLTYRFGARLFARNSEANSYNNTLTYQNLLATSPRGSLRMGATFNSGRVNGFDQGGSQLVGEGDILPNGDVEFIAYGANIGYRHLLTQDWTGELTLFGAAFIPTGGEGQTGPTKNIEQRIRAERRFRRHLLAFDFRTAFNREELPEVQRTLTLGPGVSWTWNASESISTNAAAGIDIIGEYPSVTNGLRVPRASASVTYSHERGRATVGWTRGVASNLFGGDTTINTQYFANVGLPLRTKRPMGIALAAAYATGDIIDLALGESRGSTERRSADISYALELARGWQLGVRFETSKQIQIDLLPDMTQFEATTYQTQGMLVLGGQFPATAAAQVPPRSRDRVESGDSDFQRGADSGGNGAGGNGAGGNGAGGGGAGGGGAGGGGG